MAIVKELTLEERVARAEAAGKEAAQAGMTCASDMVLVSLLLYSAPTGDPRNKVIGETWLRAWHRENSHKKS